MDRNKKIEKLLELLSIFRTLNLGLTGMLANIYFMYYTSTL